MSSLEFGWTWHLLTAERESHSSARFASSKLPHGVSSASASGDWRAGPKCRKKVTANQVTLWPQWAGLVCWLVVTKCPLHGSAVLSVYLCWCSNSTEWELRCGVLCVVVPIQPRELSCGVPHVDVPFQLSDFSFLFLFFFLPMISQGCNLCIFLLYQLKLALFCAVRSKK